MSFLVLVLFDLLSNPSAHSNVANAVEPSVRDVEFARIGDRVLQLDLYQPNASIQSASPLIVWVHGGAWRSGSKDDVPILPLLDHGFAIASVDYRLSPEAKFPAQAHDIHAAIRFLRANANRFALNRDRFVIAGASAGGHLATLVGVTCDNAELQGNLGDCVNESSRVQAIVSFYGAANLETILRQSTPFGLQMRIPALKLLLGELPSEQPRLAKLASPVSHIDANDPPLWLIHGDADPQMPIDQSRELVEVYRQHSLPVQFNIVPGGQHGGAEFYSQDRLDRLAAELR